MESALNKPLVGNLVYSLLGRSSLGNWKGKPADWSDIRTDCPTNSIALYAAHKNDFSQYDNLGLYADCSGGYNVFIDGVQYGTTYASGTTCSITWSTSGITTGDDITIPSTMKAHKIWVIPATEGNNITQFRCRRVAASGNEEQGVLWAHLNLQNYILLNRFLGSESTYYNSQLLAVTSKNNKIYVSESGFNESFYKASQLEYVPSFIGKGSDIVYNTTGLFRECSKIKEISLQNMKITSCYGMFNACHSLENIKCKNVNVIPTHSSLNSMYYENFKLKALMPTTYTSSIQRMSTYAVYCKGLEDTVIDVRGATSLKNIDCYSNGTYFAAGIKGLRVSNEAPFDYSSSPQINVSYTGMDRSALVTLFNDLPYNVGYTVVGSPTINNGVVSGFSSSDYLTIQNSITFNGSLDINVSFTNSDIPTSGSTNYQTIFRLVGNSSEILSIIASVASAEIRVYYRQTNGSLKNYYIPFTTFANHNIRINISNNKIYIYGDNTLYTEDDFIINVGNILNSLSLGSSLVSTLDFFGGSIDLNNTYIKVNDVYWFRGQPAMTKTLSCVGATGTADLTQDDKDIALNKGWSLTLS